MNYCLYLSISLICLLKYFNAIEYNQILNSTKPEHHVDLTADDFGTVDEFENVDIKQAILDELSRNGERLTADVIRFLDNPTQSYGKIEGDIELPSKSIINFSDPNYWNLAYSAVAQNRRLWLNGIIPYQLSSAYQRYSRNMIAKAISHIHKKTICLRFVQRTNQTDYLFIRPILGCSSQVGRTGGRQDVSLDASCFLTKYLTVVHELMHAAGLYHEQARYDRDSHVLIHWNNIVPTSGIKNQFEKRNESVVSLLGLPYDQHSLMHYKEHDFSVTPDLRTISAKDGGILSNNHGLTDIDVMKINSLYNCIDESVSPKINKSFAGNLVRKEGTSASFPCASSAVSPSRSWKKNDQVIHSDSTNDLRIENDGSLHINYVNTTHEGTYECKVTNMAGSATVTYMLIVISPPQIHLNVAGSVSIISGMPINLACVATGTPTPKTSWKKDGILVSSIANIQEKDGNLTVDSALLIHSGHYTCIATNLAGVDRQETSVMVNELPKITDDFDPSVYLIQGKSIELRCRATGVPQPTVNWYKNHRKIVHSHGTSDFEILQDGTLVIRNARQDLCGRYECQAANLAGYDSKTAMVSLLEAPKMSLSSETQGQIIRGDRVILFCPVTTAPILNITWEYENEIISGIINPNFEFSDDFRRMIILEIRLEDTGMYKCIARNPAGKAEKELLVKVVAPPTFDKICVDHLVVEGTPFVLNCDLAHESGESSHKITWTFEASNLTKVSQTEHGRKSKYAVPSATRSHEGRYFCDVTNDAGNDRLVHTVLVIQPPVILNTELVVLVDKNTTGTLSCRTTGNPTPSITWWHNSENVVDLIKARPGKYAIVGKHMMLNNAEEADVGAYECIAKNLAGENRLLINVDVLFGPSFTEFDRSYTINETHTVTMKCNAISNPEATITWFKTDIEISLLEKPDNIILSPNRDTLVIKNATEFDNGTYQCRAQNTIDAIMTDIHLHVYGDKYQPQVTCEMQGYHPRHESELKHQLINHFTNHHNDDNAIPVALQIIKSFDNANWFVVSCNNNDDVSWNGRINVKVDDRKHMFYYYYHLTWEDATNESVKLYLNSIQWAIKSADDVKSALCNHFSGYWDCVISSNNNTIVYGNDIIVRVNNDVKFVTVFKWLD